MKNSKLFILPLMMLLMISSALAYASISRSDLILHIPFEINNNNPIVIDDVNNIQFNFSDYALVQKNTDKVMGNSSALILSDGYLFYNASDDQTIFSVSEWTINYWVKDDWRNYDNNLFVLAFGQTNNYVKKDYKKTLVLGHPRNYTNIYNSALGEKANSFFFFSLDGLKNIFSEEVLRETNKLNIDNDWHMFTLVFNGKHHYLYIDGNFITKIQNRIYYPSNSSIINTDEKTGYAEELSINSIYIGGIPGFTSIDKRGFKIDELTIFKKALTPKQILIMHEAYEKRINPFEYQAKVGSHLGMHNDKVEEVTKNVGESVKEQTQKSSSKGFFNAFFTPIKSFFSSFFSFLGI